MEEAGYGATTSSTSAADGANRDASSAADGEQPDDIRDGGRASGRRAIIAAATTAFVVLAAGHVSTGGVTGGGASSNLHADWWNGPSDDDNNGFSGDGDGGIDEAFLETLNSVGSMYEAHCVIESALCDIAVCTLNEDQATATCACQRMPASAGNPAIVQLGWGSVALAGHWLYRDVLRECDAGRCTNRTLDKLCHAIENGEMYSNLTGIAEGGHGVSLYSLNPLSSLANTSWSDQVRCPNSMLAACMGAPCYEKAYDSPVFNLECVCPVTTGTCKTADLEGHGDGGLCGEVSDSHPSCAASCKGDWKELVLNDPDDVKTLVDNVEKAKPTGNKSTCPTYGGRLPWYS